MPIVVVDRHGPCVLAEGFAWRPVPAQNAVSSPSVPAQAKHEKSAFPILAEIQIQPFPHTTLALVKRGGAQEIWYSHGSHGPSGDLPWNPETPSRNAEACKHCGKDAGTHRCLDFACPAVEGRWHPTNVFEAYRPGRGLPQATQLDDLGAEINRCLKNGGIEVADLKDVATLQVIVASLLKLSGNDKASRLSVESQLAETLVAILGFASGRGISMDAAISERLAVLRENRARHLLLEASS